MGRCVATGQAIAVMARVESRVLAALNDIDYGEWQGSTRDDVRALWPELFQLWHDAPHLVRFPGGESLQDAVARAADALRFVRERHRDGTIVLVGHDSTNRALLLQLLDQPLSAYWRLAQDPCGISEIEITADIRIRRVNETLHLEGIS
jgi:probable phosphoglycerate mutase